MFYNPVWYENHLLSVNNFVYKVWGFLAIMFGVLQNNASDMLPSEHQVRAQRKISALMLPRTNVNKSSELIGFASRSINV